MNINNIRTFLFSLLLLPSILFAQATADTVDTIDTIIGTDGTGATSGWWWFWVVILLAIVALAIWWAARAGTPSSGAHPRSGGGTQR